MQRIHPKTGALDVAKETSPSGQTFLSLALLVAAAGAGAGPVGVVSAGEEVLAVAVELGAAGVCGDWWRLLP